MANGQFPDTLVLPFTSLYGGSSGCPDAFAAQLQQGNTFSAAFDMSQAPHAPGQSGLVFLKADPQSNFEPNSSVQLSNEGLSDKIAFMSINGLNATIFGQALTVSRVWLMGTPDGEVFTWQAGMIIGDGCVVSNVPLDETTVAKLTREAVPA